MKRTRLLLTMVATMLLTTTNLFAQGPNDSGTYYANADGKKGAALKTALHEIIKKNHGSNSYNDLWTYFRTTDKREDGKVWDMYSGISNYTFGTDQAGNYSGEGENNGGKYNREHSFPNSWFGGNKQHIAYSDLFHLYPTDGKVNGMRSNYCFGENTGNKGKSINGFSKLGTCTYAGSGAPICFEPNDIYKGDFARTYFYMVTRYEDEIVSWFQSYGNLDGVSQTLAGNTYPGLNDWQVNMFIEWSKKDPIDQPIAKETPRNKAVYGIQGNRNPFIDYPGLEEYIWGSLKDVAFSYDHYVVPASIMTVKTERTYMNGTMYNMAGQVVDKSYKGLVIMNGRKFVNK